MKNSDQMVLVVARKSADFLKLTGSESPISNACGAIGRIIAAKVLEGGGRATVRASDIKMAIDNCEGVNAIHDNFDLFDKHTLEPLLYHLLKNMSLQVSDA